MDTKDNDVSRRDALKLARLGALLGAGLCVVKGAEAQEDDSLRVNTLQMKLRSNTLNGLLLPAVRLPDDLLAKIAGDGSVRVQIKFFRPGATGKEETIFAQTTQIKWAQQKVKRQ